MAIRGLVDTYIVYQFIRILTKRWKQLPAYKLGIIDANGKQLKKSTELKTTKEKNAYTIGHRFIFNIKRLLEKIPGGRSKLASFSAALWLIKEDVEPRSLEDMEAEVERFLSKMEDPDLLFEEMEEETDPDIRLMPGRYRLLDDVVDEDGNTVKAGAMIVIKDPVEPDTIALGEPVFTVLTTAGDEISVSLEDLGRA